MRGFAPITHQISDYVVELREDSPCDVTIIFACEK